MRSSSVERALTRCKNELVFTPVGCNDRHQVSADDVPLAELHENVPRVRVIPPHETLEVLEVLCDASKGRSRTIRTALVKRLRRASQGTSESRVT
jgi:hypothetical protein